MSTDTWSWPAELDALTAAPGNRQVLLENVGEAQLRVIEQQP
jgi:hypothetical protein